MKKNIVIKLFKKDGKFRATPESRAIIDGYTDRDELDMEIITAERARSLAQNRDYWGHWLPCFCSNVPNMDAFVDAKDSGAMSYERAHELLKMKWVIARQRHDLIKTTTIYKDGKFHEVGIVSISFSDCRQEDANDFFNFVHEIFFKIIGKDLDSFTAEQGMHP